MLNDIICDEISLNGLRINWVLSFNILGSILIRNTQASLLIIYAVHLCVRHYYGNKKIGNWSTNMQNSVPPNLVIVLKCSVFESEITDSIWLIYISSSQLHKSFQVSEPQFFSVNILGYLNVYILTWWQDSIE